MAGVLDFLRPRRGAEALQGAAAEGYRQLMEVGYAHLRGALPAALIDRTLAGVKDLFRRNEAIFAPHVDESGHHPRLINLHAAYRPLLDLFVEATDALAVQDAFFGGRPSSVYTSLYFERGSAQTIHRDSPVFTTRPEHRYLGVWVALEDADEGNGCLQVIAGGHRVPDPDRTAIALRHVARLEDVPAQSAEMWNDYQSGVVEACRARGLAPSCVPAKKGDVAIWHPQLPHGGSPIREAHRSRHSFVMHVTPVGVPVYHQDVFFHPGKAVPDRASWRYARYGGRRFVARKSVDIGHREARRVTEFR